MNKIQLIDTLPNVFLSRSDIMSDIWQQKVTFEKGGLYLVEANSGTGKSSLCSYIFGYRHDYQGQILFDGEDISQYAVGKWTEIRKRHIALLWQELRLFPELTAWENVQIKNTLTKWRSARQIDEWFEAFGIADKRDEQIARMSFGQQQRVAMIRALVQPFCFLLADEPISHLDEANSQSMADVLLSEVQAQGAGLLLTSVGKHMDISYSQTLRL